MLSQKLRTSLEYFALSYVSGRFIFMLSEIKDSDEEQSTKIINGTKKHILNSIYLDYLVQSESQNKTNKDKDDIRVFLINEAEFLFDHFSKIVVEK